MPLGLSGGDHVNIIAREDRTVTNGAGCSDGAEIQAIQALVSPCVEIFTKETMMQVRYRKTCEPGYINKEALTTIKSY